MKAIRLFGSRAALVFGMAVASTSCDEQKNEPKAEQKQQKADDVRMMTGHDEPIIIEQGSAKVNFSPTRNAPVGRLFSDGMTYLRLQAKEFTFAKIWRLPKAQGSKWALYDCAGTGCKISTTSVVLVLKGNKNLHFDWFAGDYTPVIMQSEKKIKFKKQQESGNDLEHKIIDYDANLEIDEIILNGTKYTLRDNTIDKIDVQLCSADDSTHCKALH